MQDAEIEPNPAIAGKTGPVPGGGTLVWRILAGEPGRHTLRFIVSGTVVEKQIVIGDGLQRVSATQPAQQWTSLILHPVEPPLTVDSPVRSVEILYDGLDSWIYGANYWIVYFLVVSMVSALLLKPVFKVRF